MDQFDYGDSSDDSASDPSAHGLNWDGNENHNSSDDEGGASALVAVPPVATMKKNSTPALTMRRPL